MDVKNLAELYDLAPPAWAPIEARLDQGLSFAPGSGGPDRHSCWLATIDPDGRPHVTGIGALWADGDFWFETGRWNPNRRDPAEALVQAFGLPPQVGSSIVAAQRAHAPDLRPLDVSVHQLEPPHGVRGLATPLRG
jgi:hypothetical protein